MSERSFTGAVTVEDMGLAGMITVRADLSDPGVMAALGTMLDLPGPGEVRGRDGLGALWMSPDELLVVCDHGVAEGQAAVLTRTLEGRHALVVNVSDARAVFRLSGSGSVIRETLAKLTPADLRASALPPDRLRRTRIAQVAAAFWFTGEDEALLICFRSVGDYVFGLLRNAATDGAEVRNF